MFDFPTHEFLNSPAEWHAVMNGFYVAFTAKPTDKSGQNGKEKHYWRFGWLLGWIAKSAVILFAGPKLLPI